MWLETPALDCAALDIVPSAMVKHPDARCLAIFILLIKRLSEFVTASRERVVRTPHSLDFTAQELHLPTCIL